MVSKWTIKDITKFKSKNSLNQNWFDELSNSNDFENNYIPSIEDKLFCISYYRTLIKSELLQTQVLPHLKLKLSLEELQSIISLQPSIISNDSKQIKNKLIQGFVAIRNSNNESECLLVNVSNNFSRNIGPPMMESSILGPQVGFVEEIDTNINLIRKKLPIADLQIKELTVGELSNTKVAVMYINGIADKENLNTVIQRLEDIQYDHILDSSSISEMMADNANSLFPQTITTERSDRATAGLTEGKIIILVDGSPNVLIAPALIAETIIAIEDYYESWILATFFRLLRIFGLFTAVFITPLYVAVLTYHYELIPIRLLESLVASRASVPFPPIIEVLFLELTIELVKEAGLRLPIKIGQTLGIVGGIVIGQAVVEAKLTSNILLILVGLGTLASYTSAIYKFNNTIRFLRFPIIILSQLLGLLGIMMGFIYLITHILRLTSLGRPYLGLYPFRTTAINDLWFRLPFSKQTKNPKNLRPGQIRKSTRDMKRPGPPSDFDE